MKLYIEIDLSSNVRMPYTNARWVLRELPSSIGSFSPFIEAGKPHEMPLFDREGMVCGKWGVR